MIPLVYITNNLFIAHNGQFQCYNPEICTTMRPLLVMNALLCHYNRFL